MSISGEARRGDSRLDARSPRGRAGIPTLRQKAHLPQRLRDLLAGGLRCDVLLVQAPAGCGKTAAVVQSLLDEGIDPFWYSCLPEDADPAHFVAGLVEALGAGETPAGRTTLAALASRDITRSYRAICGSLIDHLQATLDSSAVLVLDDADAIVASPEAIEITDHLLTALSGIMHIVVVSRAELPLPSQARRKVDGTAARITADDLLLREDEVAACAEDAYSVTLSAEEASSIYRATNGWMIALRLAFRLRDLGAPVERELQPVFTPDVRKDLFAYLAAEVLTKVEPRIEAFLRETAVLDTLDPDICGRITGEPRPAELVQSLAAAGLPVMKAGWSTYRSHGLLRDYFLDAMTPHERAAAHRRAGRAFAEAGDWPLALSHYASAGDTVSALALSSEHGRELFYSGRGRALLALVKSADSAQLASSYRAEYWAAMSASRLFDLDWASAAFERVAAAASAAGDDITAQDALRSLTQVLNGWGRYAQAEGFARQLLAAVPEHDIAGRAAVTIGYLITSMGGTDQFREAVALVRKLLPELLVEPRCAPEVEAYARAVAAVTLAMEGDFAAARAELAHCDVLIAGIGPDNVTTFVPWSRALVEFIAADPEAADSAAHRAEDLALEFGDLQRVLECRAVLASVQVMRGNLDAADRAFAQLDELRAGGADYWGIILTMLSRPHRARLRGDIAGGLAAAEANLALALGLSSARFSCSSRLDVAYLRLLAGDADGAREHARLALEEARALSSDLMIFAAGMMVAATSAGEGDVEMQEALAVAEHRDYRFVMPYTARLPQLDAALWQALDGPGAGRAAILLESMGPVTVTALTAALPTLSPAAAANAVDVARRFGSPGRPALEALTTSTERAVSAAAREALASMDAANPHGLSLRELEVLRLLARGMRTREVAAELVVTSATVSTHIQRIMNKTGTASRAELIRLALSELPGS